MNKYEKNIRVDANMIDCFLNMAPSSILGLFQAITSEHTTYLEVDAPTLMKKYNISWVISKIHYETIKSPRWEDNIICQTFPLKPGAVRCERQTAIYDEYRNLMVKSHAEWTLIDVTTHRPLKSSSINFPDVDFLSDLIDDTPYERFDVLFDDSNYVLTKKVLFTDLDFNMHTNNTYYAKWAMDCFSIDELEGLVISEFEIHFLRPSVINDEIKLYKVNKDAFYIIGMKDDLKIFEIKIKLKEQ